MRLRTAVAAGALTAVTPLSLSTGATAQGDKDCKDYASQKEAQRTFDADTSDPQNIDTDDDQKACETWPPGPGDPSNAGDGGEAPEGSVDAGSGGASQGPAATGWWRDGPEPGEKGPAVLVGHYDSDTGPAVFHRLADLRPGDAVLVDRADGSTATFRVRASESHAQDSFPTARVYGDTDGRADLRLITCGGRYDRTEGHYLENLIVYAELAATGTTGTTGATGARSR